MPVLPQRYEMADVSSLKEHPDNPRRGNVDAVADSVRENGFYGALVIQKSTNYVLAGNHRLQAARREGIAEVPAVFLDVDDERARRILLVDNRSNDLAGYDTEALVAVLGGLPDLAGTGYDADALSELVATLETQGPAAGNLPGEEDDAGGFGHQYGVIVTCEDEAQQQEVYEQLDGMGYRARVVTT